MKNVMFVLFLIFVSFSAMSQTTLKHHRHGVLISKRDSQSTEAVVGHIINSLKEQAHSSKTGAIYDVKLLFPDECYRELINKTTGTSFFILVKCNALHARKGLYFMRKYSDNL